LFSSIQAQSSTAGNPLGAAALRLSIIGADPALEAETESILSSAYAELVRSSGFAIDDTVHVQYVRRHESFDSVVGGRFPDWGVAAAVAERNLIAVRSPADYPLGRTLRETLRHELAHLHLDAMSGLRQMPRWMHEGYAQQIAHQWEFGDDLLIARAVFFDQAISLRDIDGVNSFSGGRAQLAYAQSYLAMNHFLSTYGWDGLQIFCETIRLRENWDVAFQEATGADYAAFQKEFDDFLHIRYNWIAFLGDTILLWIVLVGVFIAIYIVKRKRSAAKRAEWEQQEAIEDILYGPFRSGGPGSQAPPQDDQH
jgi:hypothetical protein